MMDASEVIENLKTSPIGEVPSTESQARPLAKLEPEQQPAAWEKAQEIAKEEGKTSKDPMHHNLHRRHLTESQRGMVAAKLATMKNGRPETTSIDAVSKAEACEALKVGVSTLDRARKIQRIGAPELVAAVESGQVTVGAAYKARPRR